VLPSLLRPAGALGQSTEEEDLRDFLEQAIELEQGSRLAYDTAVESPHVEAAVKGTLELLRDQEQAHANAWRSAIDSLGFEPPDPPSEPADVEELEGLDELQRSEELLAFLAEREQALIDGYLDLAPGLESEDLARTSAEVVGSHAQHLVVVRTALGEDPAQVLVRLARG
jgi:rubrerythrin